MGIQHQINIDFNSLAIIRCECLEDGEKAMWTPIWELRYIPAFMSPTGKGGLVQVEIGYKCDYCGMVKSSPDLIAAKDKINLVTGGDAG